MSTYHTIRSVVSIYPPKSSGYVTVQVCRLGQRVLGEGSIIYRGISISRSIKSLTLGYLFVTNPRGKGLSSNWCDFICTSKGWSQEETFLERWETAAAFPFVCKKKRTKVIFLFPHLWSIQLLALNSSSGSHYITQEVRLWQRGGQSTYLP